MRVWSLGGEDPLEESVATHSSMLAWRIPWTEDLGRLQSGGCTELDTLKWLCFLYIKYIYIYIYIYVLFLKKICNLGTMIFPPYYRWENWGSKRLNDLPQLLNIEAEILKKWILPRSLWSQTFVICSTQYILAESIFITQLTFPWPLPHRNNCSISQIFIFMHLE